MASLTRRSIMDSFLRLLEDRPVNKISVKDIVEDCGINRNTFYYHFEDISAVISAIIIDEVDRVIETYKDISLMEECFEAALRLGHDHRNAIYHIYNSSSRDYLERQLMEICKYVATRFVDRTAADMTINPMDREIIIHSYQCELFGHIIDWLDSGMDDKAEQRIMRLCELRAGSTQTMLERSRIQ